MNVTKLYVAGKTNASSEHAGQWELHGIYTLEADAKAATIGEEFFYYPIQINTDQPDWTDSALRNWYKGYLSYRDRAIV